MNLRPRLILLTLLLFAISAPLVWLTVRSVAEDIVEQWAVRYAEKQVLYDKARGLQPILHEVELSRQLAASPLIRQWASAPNDPGLTRRALSELESYRKFFSDHSYFAALVKNDRYYYNNAANAYAGKQFRYRLDPKAPKDAWFFDLVNQNKRDVHINVNPDPELGVTKLWIDVLVRSGGKVLGIVGTGLELTPFIKRSIDNVTPGISTLFIDFQGAIQLYRDQDLIDYASITKHEGEHKTINLLFQSDGDRQAVRAAMKRAREGEKVATASVRMKGRQYLVSVAYLPELDWYEVNLLDLAVILPYSQFTNVGVVFLLVLLVTLVLFYLVLGRLVIRPLQNLEHAMVAIESGREQPMPKGGGGEIGRLTRHFGRLVHDLLEANHDLEARVAERTQALDRLSKIDPLTELLNRRGMTERIAAELARVQREGGELALLWVDVDQFKAVNDQYGHGVGDDALKTVAQLIRDVLRPYDVAARWGGDEFLIMLDRASVETMNLIGARLHDSVVHGATLHGRDGGQVSLTVSIGGYLARAGEGLEEVLNKADRALYAAKAAGRNRYQPFVADAHAGDASGPDMNAGDSYKGS